MNLRAVVTVVWVRRVLVFMLSLAALLVTGCEGSEENASERLPAPWAVTGVSGDQRTVSLSFEHGDCKREDPRVDVTEARDTIKIEVTERLIKPPPDGPCLASLKIGRLKAALRSPLAGRRIEGLHGARFGAPPGPSRRHGDHFVNLVPRVAGLAVVDARLVLADYGFRSRAAGAATDETVGTRPGAGTEGTRAFTPRRLVQILSRPRR